jgi:hypothetical protein
LSAASTTKSKLLGLRETCEEGDIGDKKKIVSINFAKLPVVFSHIAHSVRSKRKANSA